MKNRYDGSASKDANIANTRQKRYEAEHMAKNNFVKKQQREMDKYAGRRPNMPADLNDFNATMQNTGAWAQEFGKKLTSNIDHVAFPVDGEGNDS